jgi:ribonuclease HI
MEDLRKGAKKIFKEHWGVRATQVISCSAKRSSNWSRPPTGIIKINVDAAIHSSFFVIAAVARDWRGEVVFAISKKANTTVPVQAEAEAFLWALQLAMDHQYGEVIIEGDSKCCVDAFSNKNDNVSWRILNVAHKVWQLSESIHRGVFNWVSREANSGPHELANWAAKHCPLGVWDFQSGPQYFVSNFLKKHHPSGYGEFCLM